MGLIHSLANVSVTAFICCRSYSENRVDGRVVHSREPPRSIYRGMQGYVAIFHLRSYRIFIHT